MPEGKNQETILVVNTWSTSLKIKLLRELADETFKALAAINVNNIGKEGAESTIKYSSEESWENFKEYCKLWNHREAAQTLLDILRRENSDINPDKIEHRIVNWWPEIDDVTPVDEETKIKFDVAMWYAMHNPKAKEVLKVSEEQFPSAKEFFAPDTAFHKTIPHTNRIDPITGEYINPIWAHGWVHKWNLNTAAKLLEKKPEEINIISLHVGGGSSITAIKKWKSYDTSMSSTPVNWLPMETRSGNVDPDRLLSFMEEKDLTPGEMREHLNKKSWIIAMSNGEYNDLYSIEQRCTHPEIYTEEEVKKCQEIMDAFIASYIKFIGSYAFELGNVDAIVLSGWAFENSAWMREKVLSELEKINWFGFKFNKGQNDSLWRGNLWVISDKESKVTAIINPADEELTIAEAVDKYCKNKVL